MHPYNTAVKIFVFFFTLSAVYCGTRSAPPVKVEIIPAPVPPLVIELTIVIESKDCSFINPEEVKSGTWIEIQEDTPGEKCLKLAPKPELVITEKDIVKIEKKKEIYGHSMAVITLTDEKSAELEYMTGIQINKKLAVAVRGKVITATQIIDKITDHRLNINCGSFEEICDRILEEVKK
jgi:hypothetical protein